MKAVARKGRRVTSDRRLRDLVLDYIDIRSKLAKIGHSRAERDLPPVHLIGPLAAQVGGIPALDKLLAAWSERTHAHVIKAHHHIFTLPLKDSDLPPEAVARFCMAHTLSAYRAYQAWCRSDADISVAVGFHDDRPHAHDHALVDPRDSLNRPLNFSRLAPVKTPDGVVRIDFQGYLQKAFMSAAGRFHDRDETFDRDPALSRVAPTRTFPEWYCSLYAAFKKAEATGQSVLPLFEAAMADRREQLAASDASTAELSNLRSQFRGPGGAEAGNEVIGFINSRLAESRTQRDLSVQNCQQSGHADGQESESRLSATRARLASVKKAREDVETHRLRAIYGAQRAAQIRALVQGLATHAPVPDRTDAVDLTPLDRVLQRALIRMHHISEDRRPIDLHRDAGVLFSPFEAPRSNEWQKSTTRTKAPAVEQEYAEVTIRETPLPRISLPRLAISDRQQRGR